MRRYDWTPKTYHPNTEPQEVFVRLGLMVHCLVGWYYCNLAKGTGNFIPECGSRNSLLYRSSKMYKGTPPALLMLGKEVDEENP